jgi:hypothetical protein
MCTGAAARRIAASDPACRWPVLGARADRVAAEIVRHVPAHAHFDADAGRGFDIAHTQAERPDRVQREAFDLRSGATAVAPLLFARQLQRRLVVELVVPALEAVDAFDVGHQILHLPCQRRRADGTQRQLARIQRLDLALHVESAVVPGQAGVQQSGIGPVVDDELAARRVRRGVHRLAELDDGVLQRCGALRQYAGSRLRISAACRRSGRGRQAGSAPAGMLREMALSDTPLV